MIARVPDPPESRRKNDHLAFEQDEHRAVELLQSAHAASPEARVDLMLAIAERFPVRGALARAYLRAADTIASSPGRHRVLAAPLEGGRAPRHVVEGVLDAATRIRSCGERARLLVRIATRYSFEDDLLYGFLEAADGIESSLARCDVLRALLLGQRLRTGQLVEVFKATGRILSSTARADVLLAAAATQTIEGDARACYRNVAAAISAHARRRRALLALEAS
jgi:hypothetical protein